MRRLPIRFQMEQPEVPMPIPKAPPKTNGLVAKGREVYEKAECGECHGRNGRGDGPSANQLKDDWGVPVRPAERFASQRRNGRIMSSEWIGSHFYLDKYK